MFKWLKKNKKEIIIKYMDEKYHVMIKSRLGEWKIIASCYVFWRAEELASEVKKSKFIDFDE